MSRSTFRVQASISEGYPDLYEELAALPVKARSDRLRFLAAIGLMAVRSGAPVFGHSAPPNPPNPPPDHSADAAHEKEGVSTKGAKDVRREVLAEQASGLLAGL